VRLLVHEATVRSNDLIFFETVGPGKELLVRDNPVWSDPITASTFRTRMIIKMSRDKVRCYPSAGIIEAVGNVSGVPLADLVSPYDELYYHAVDKPGK
jgi:hypothetical protein